MAAGAVKGTNATNGKSITGMRDTATTVEPSARNL
jgi:hypothetical protein